MPNTGTATRSSPLRLSPEVQHALERDHRLVALESTLIAHAFPLTERRDVALAIEQAVRDEGAIPATVMLEGGLAHIGLDDELLDRLTRVSMHAGGSAANVAAWAAPLGQDARFLGVVGDDRTAAFLVADLCRDGVAVQTIPRQETRSRSIAVLIEEDGNRSIVSDYTAALAPRLEDYDPRWWEGVSWLHLVAHTYINHQSRDFFTLLLREAHRRGIPVSIDPAAAHMLAKHCDHAEVLEVFHGARILFPSHDEAEYLSGLSDPKRAANALLELADVVAVTCGAEGAHIASRLGEQVFVPAHTARVTNALGAGDAFAGGFLHAHLRGDDLTAAARSAAQTAARAVRLPSAR